LLTSLVSVGDYSMFVQNWEEPSGGIYGYLNRFLESNDPTFQHIAIWTLLQLLESDSLKLKLLISQSTEIAKVIQEIANKPVDSDDEGDDGEAEVVLLARKCADLLEA
jgi:vacuolar protein 8